jgi:hypothetical protein
VENVLMKALRLFDPVFWSFAVSDWLLEMTERGRVPWWRPFCPSHWAGVFLTWLDVGHNWR